MSDAQEEKRRLRAEVEARARADVEAALRSLEGAAGEFRAPEKPKQEEPAARLARSAKEYEEMGYAVAWSADRGSFTASPPAALAAFGAVKIDLDSL